MARAAWAEADATWEYEDGATVSGLGSLLATSLTYLKSNTTKLSAWRSAAAKLTNKAKALSKETVAWYAAATRKFPVGTTEGDMIRSTVPTTTRPEAPVGQAVISNLMASGGDVHFDCSAPHATRFTYLHQPPGTPTFLVIVADSPDTSLTLHNQPPGLHRFKAVGQNSHGDGPESAVVETTLSAAQAA